MNAHRASFLAVAARTVLHGFTAAIAASLVLSALVLLLLPAAHAMSGELSGLDNVAHPADVKKGSLLFRTPAGLKDAPLLETDVRFDIAGLVSRARLRQTFMNESNDWVEAVYVFPLPDDAAVDKLRMHIGERIIEGRIKEREEAKKTYEQAKKNGQRTSLVEQQRPNIFTTSIANIGPGETIQVEIEFQQSLTYDNEQFSLRFPMVVAPRFIPGRHRVHGFDGHGWGINTDEVPDARRITPYVVRPGNGAINPVTVEINLDCGFPIQSIMSPYHDIDIEQKDTDQYIITLKNGTMPANRDFELVWRPVSGRSPRAALFTEHHGNYDYAQVMLLPPATGSAKSLKREVIFVIDTSGSMAGESIRQARNALLLALQRLQSGDHFNIIRFDSTTDSLFPEPQVLNRQSLATALHYVRKLDAGGGTVMLPALEMSLLKSSGHYDVRQVVFLTDGSVGNENVLFETIRRHLGDTRLFTVGIGSAPNAYFMRRASRFGRGSYTFIGDVSEVGERMNGLFIKLESAVMTTIRISGVRQTEMYPRSLPDLYSGEPMMFTLRTEDLPDSLTVSGTVNGQAWSAELMSTDGRSHAGVAKLWAREKIAALMDQRGSGNEKEHIKRQVLDVALDHHLVSNYTSLVAVDVTPARVREALLKTRPLPINLPHGWEYENVFGTMPQTATPALWNMIIGLFMAMLGFCIIRIRHYV